MVVVGAGPTGLVTANLLGFEKIQTLLIEKHESTVQAPRAVSIDDEALRTIQSFGLVEKVLADINIGLRVLVFHSKWALFRQSRTPNP